jgi:hypothetical protein
VIGMNNTNELNKNIINGTVQDNMGNMRLNQAEADGLIKVKKIFLDKTPLTVNRPYNEQRELKSERDPYEVFYLNVTQTRIEFGKYGTVTRFFQIPLVRACINPDARHENPDGEILSGSHIHIYKQGYADKFAYPLKEHGFDDMLIVPFIKKFLEYCNIEEIEINEQSILMGRP